MIPCDGLWLLEIPVKENVGIYEAKYSLWLHSYEFDWTMEEWQYIERAYRERPLPAPLYRMHSKHIHITSDNCTEI